MDTADYFLSLKPAPPWSSSAIGLPALALVAFALIALTYLTYARTVSRRKFFIILSLRVAALLIALVTALRPSLGIQEDPKVPSTLLVGVDLSESMNFRDEFNNQSRIAAVRKVLDSCAPTLETLKAEQGVNVVMYGFGNADWSEAAGLYNPESPAAFKQSDYAAYLQRSFDKWQTERFLRAHIILGDGADNGPGNGEAEAARYRPLAPIHTFLAGKSTTRPDGKDVAVAAVSADPSPVPIKNDVAIKVSINSFGFPNAKVPVRVSFNGEQVALETVTLTKEIGNEITITVKAPEKAGEVKVRVEVPIETVSGDANPANNVLETYLTVTKEGVRLLIVDRDRFEHTFIRDVLRAEKRFDITDVVRQRDDPASPKERAAFDFDNRHYDAIILGNISAKQLAAIDPQLHEKITQQVTKHGTGLIMLGGDASFAGTLDRPLDSGWKGTAIEGILPVSLTAFPNLPEGLFRGDDRRFQTVPSERGLQYLLKVAPTEKLAAELWDKINAFESRSKITALARMGEPKKGAVVYAVANDDRVVVKSGEAAVKYKPPDLLVGWETGGDGKGRVLAFAGYDTYMWRAFGRRSAPPTRDGLEMHAQFWRRVSLWLAKQDDADGAAYAKPEYRRLPVRGKQSVLIGLKNPEGAEIPNATLEAKVLLPGQTAEQAAVRLPLSDAEGKRRIEFNPAVPGEYTVLLKANGKDSAGKDVAGEATARFIAYPEASDELLRAAADGEYLERLARASGGQAHVLSDLPQFLNELKGQPLLTAKKPRFIPDWRRNHSHGFLPAWVAAFALVLGAEWGLRRLWGLA